MITHFMFPTKLTWLNSGNKTAEIQICCLKDIMAHFGEPLTVCEVGCAYGGGVEAMAKVMGTRGNVYGFDTFEGHPEDLSDDPTSLEARAMDFWYRPEVAGKEKLAIEYQEQVLKDEGLTNAHLIKGRVHEHSFDFLGPIHLAMLDMDLIKPTRLAYEGIKDKIVEGGYLFFHDAYPPTHLPYLYHFVHDEVLKDGRWTLERDEINGYLTVLKRI